MHARHQQPMKAVHTLGPFVSWPSGMAEELQHACKMPTLMAATATAVSGERASAS